MIDDGVNMTVLMHEKFQGWGSPRHPQQIPGFFMHMAYPE